MNRLITAITAAIAIAGCSATPDGVPDPATTAPPPITDAETAVEDEVPALLRDDAPLTKRALVGDGIWASWDGTTRNLPWDEISDSAIDPPVEAHVVEAKGDLFRLRLETYKVRYLIYAKREQLVRVPTTRVMAATKPAKVATTSGVELAPGARIELAEVKDGFARTKSKVPGVAFDLWLPEDKLGAGYATHDFSPFDSERILEATGPEVPFFEAPKGASLAVITIDEAVGNMRPLGEPQRGFIEAEYIQARIRIRGFVPQKSVEVTEAGFGAGGLGLGGWAASHATWVEVDKGTLLYDKPGGQPIALVLEPTRLMLQNREEGWQSLGFMTAWGVLYAWAPES